MLDPNSMLYQRFEKKKKLTILLFEALKKKKELDKNKPQKPSKDQKKD